MHDPIAPDYQKPKHNAPALYEGKPKPNAAVPVDPESYPVAMSESFCSI
jgi:hypothetical protein